MPISPALLVQEPLNSCPVVSFVCDCFAVQVTGPLIVSAPLVSTVTLLVYQPFAPSVPAVTVSAADGPVLSSLTVNGAASVLRPASLVHDPVKSSPVVSSVWV